MTMLIHTSRSAATAPFAWRGSALFLARLRRFINRLVAAAIARRERQAMFVVLRNLNGQGRELKDIGIHRCRPDDAPADAARMRMQRSRRS